MRQSRNLPLSRSQSEEVRTELSHVGKLREVREVRGKLRDKCPKFKLEDYCLLTSRTTVGSDNFFNSFNS